MCRPVPAGVTMAPVHHTERLASAGGVELALHDLGGDGPPVLLCHPTGFHGLVWAPVAAELAGDAHCWALDFRGHGDSTLPAGGDMDWWGAAADVRAVTDHLGVTEGGLAAGHSMGGAALLMAEMTRPGTFARLWLFEPIVFPRVEGGGPRAGLAEAARRRRSSFPDREAAYANYAAKPPLSGIDPASLRAYVDHGFRDEGDAVVLKCAPEVEAATFDASMTAHAFERLGEVEAEVVVAAGGDGGGPVMMAPLLADALPHGRLERHPQLSHFGPMEDPPLVAEAIRRALALG